jgi:Flp pilus assembly protein TadG
VQPEEPERGFVLIWFALLIVVLLGIAAIAVDLVHAYQEEQHAQAAADAAALAGAVEIPTDASAAHPNAVNRAVNVAQLNYGFNGGGDTVTAVPDASVPNQLDVTVRRKFRTFFGSILGLGDLTVRKTAEAQYDPPAAMGSAVNHLGDVPTCSDMTTAPSVGGCTTDPTPGSWIQKLWASIQGPDSDKQSGNALTTLKCSAASSTPSVDGCEAGTNGANDEYSANGETFEVKVPSPGAWDVWVYDPAFVNTNPSCGAPPLANTDASKWNTSANPIYQAVGTNYTDLNYCPGDTFALASTGSSPEPPMETDYEVLDPADTSGNRAADPGCSSTRQTDGGIQAGNVVRFPGFADQSVNPAPVTNNGDNGPNAALDYENLTGQKSYFHQWYRLCTLSATGATTEGNEYEVQVTSPSGLGTNQFSIMVSPHGAPNIAIAGSAIFARESLPLTAVNFTPSATSNFYLARILPSSRARTLQLSFFDLGDSSTTTIKSGNLQVSTLGVTNGTLSCTSTPAPSNSAGPRVSPAVTPFPAADFTNTGCTVAYDAGSGSASWNGRWVSVDISIPAATDAVNGYRCDTTQLGNCWIQLGYTPDPGATLSDATTWDAHMIGSPVRLVG